MPRTTRLLIAAVAVAAGVAVPAGEGHAQNPPADVVDPTLGHVAPAGTAPVVIRSRHLRVRDGAVRVAVECPPLAGRCHGTLELRSLVPGARLGSVAIDLAGAERRTVRIRVRRRTRTVPGEVVFRAGEPVATKLVVVHAR
jgi:hypothetical protein